MDLTSCETETSSLSMTQTSIKFSQVDPNTRPRDINNPFWSKEPNKEGTTKKST